MIQDITVEATDRSERGKNAARRLRAQGRIPAVLYGEGQESLAISLTERHVQQILHSPTGHNTIFQLSLGGSRESAMLVDWQYDPVRGNLLHTDLKRIDLGKKLRALVPLMTKGEAKGVKTQGGLLEVVTREVEVECLPADIPGHILVDVSELEINQAIRARDVPAGGRYIVTTEPDAVLVHVIILKEEEEAKPAEAAVEGAAPAAPAEPEVIKKGKKEEEPEEGEAKAKEQKEPKEPKGKKEK